MMSVSAGSRKRGDGSHAVSTRKWPWNGNKDCTEGEEEGTEGGLEDVEEEDGSGLVPTVPTNLMIPSSPFMCGMGILQPAVRIDEIVNVFRPLARPYGEWDAASIEIAMPVLRNRVNFIAGGCTQENQAMWEVFVDEWNKYLVINPEHQAQNEHAYVNFEFSGGSVPPAFFADIATTDSRVNVTPTIRSDGSTSLSPHVRPNDHAVFLKLLAVKKLVHVIDNHIVCVHKEDLCEGRQQQSMKLAGKSFDGVGKPLTLNLLLEAILQRIFAQRKRVAIYKYLNG